MQSRQGNVLHTLLAVRQFIRDKAAQLGSVVTAGSIQKLDDTIAKLQATVTEQSTADLQAQGATQSQQALRKALIRDHMSKIARIAVVAGLPPEPELAALRLPSANISLPRLAAAAQGMAGVVTQHASVFTDFGVTPDFVAELQTAATDMEGAKVTQNARKAVRAGATKGLKDELANGRKIVSVLDSFVKSALKDDPATLAGWNTAKRISHAGKKAAPATTPVTPPATGGTPATPAVPATSATPAASAATAAPAAPATPAAPAAPAPAPAAPAPRPQTSAA
jgi:hypothetical protein